MASSQQPAHSSLCYAVDAVSAGCAATVVTPCMIVIDKAVTLNASGREALWTSLRRSLVTAVARPGTLFPSPATAGSMWALYFCTFSMANACETYFARRQQRNDLAKLGLVTGANMTTTLLKDSIFAREYGQAGAASRSVPLRSYGVWTARDAVSMASAFILPPMLAPKIQALSGGSVSHERAFFLAQLAAPVI